MGIQIALRHQTHYRYKEPISLGPQVIQLRPALHCRTPILHYSLDVTPTEHLLNCNWTCIIIVWRVSFFRKRRVSS